MNERDRIHPEYPASVAKQAEVWKRFWIESDGDANIPASTFEPAFRIVLGAMRSCRVAKLTPKLKQEKRGAPDAWLARYASGTRGVFDIDVTADGVADDFDAWWWLVRHTEIVICCDLARLDTPTLFGAVTKLTFRTARFNLSASMLSHAKECAETDGVVALVPFTWGGEPSCGWSMIVIAAPGGVGDLAADVIRRQRITGEMLEQHQDLDVAILGTTEASTFWSNGIGGDDFEKEVGAALRRGEKYPMVPRDAMRALAAAEGVAIAEGRALDAEASGMAHLVTSFVSKAVSEADPLNRATIELASRAVSVIAEDGVCERARFASEEGRALFRAELTGLSKRLQAALAARRVRARAPNAAPVSAFREIPARPINWRVGYLHLLLDDAIAFIAAVRDETGATPLILMTDLSFRELTTDWDAHEMLVTLVGQPMDEREGHWSELKPGHRVLLWWPDVSPRPVARNTGKGIETVSWGHAELRLLGARADTIFRSEWSYPTGAELKQEKFAGAGPWRDADWAALRRKTKAVAALVKGRLRGVQPVGVRDTWTLPAAAASAREGARSLIGDAYYSKAELPE